MNPSGETPDWQRKLTEDIGENPARFLDHDLVETGPEDTDHSLARMVRDRISGIDRLEVIGAWRAAERRLASEQDREPRQAVLNLLDDREAFLQEHGERPREWGIQWPHELPDRYLSRPSARQLPDKEWYWVDPESGERRPWSERPTSVASGRTFDSTGPEESVATDGSGSSCR
ncbi:hypothetical protein [Halorussus halobius]|uniref:hypothetical protein n=1 Tax=Halorussus halobius TaxID=1710537 RepID=UPI001092FD1B|nr:hypothetical protein [Halorussus halobius]